MELLEILKEIGSILLVILVLFVIPYLIIKYLLKGIFYLFKIDEDYFPSGTISAIITVTVIVFLFSLIFRMGCGTLNNKIDIPKSQHEIKERYDLSGLIGKLVYSIPDTINIYDTKKINVRISKEDVSDTIILKRFRRYREVTQEKISLSSIMKVDLVESSSTDKTIIRRINNHAEQIIDTTLFSEWIFEVTPIDYGEIELTLSVSQIRELEIYGKSYYDIPVYEKDVTIYASDTQKIGKYWEENYFIILSILSLIIIVLSRLIPKHTKISINMSNEKQTDFWNAGSLGLAIYIVTIMSIAFFKMFNISLYFVPLVFVGTILIYAIFTAVTLRDNDKISEDNFIKLMGMAIKKVPPLNWIFKEKE